VGILIRFAFLLMEIRQMKTGTNAPIKPEFEGQGHEVRDEQGQIIIVPEDERHFYDLAYRPHEEPEEWE